MHPLPQGASFRGCHGGGTGGGPIPLIRGALPLSSGFVPVLQCATRVTGASPPVGRRQEPAGGSNKEKRNGSWLHAGGGDGNCARRGYARSRCHRAAVVARDDRRSEEHTSELQST